MILNFSENTTVQYSLECINKSTNSWYFYIYQRMPEQSVNEIYSLIWMLSPYKIATDSFVKFIWSPNYSFHWLNTGKIEIGKTPLSGGKTALTLATNNSTTFNIINDTPSFSTPIIGIEPNKLSIMGGDKIPNGIFSTGIGMSSFATFAKQSYTNINQSFDTKPTYWVAITSNKITLSEVLNQDKIPNTTMINFPLNTYKLTATLCEDNLWEVT